MYSGIGDTHNFKTNDAQEPNGGSETKGATPGAIVARSTPPRQDYHHNPKSRQNTSIPSYSSYIFQNSSPRQEFSHSTPRSDHSKLEHSHHKVTPVHLMSGSESGLQYSPGALNFCNDK